MSDPTPPRVVAIAGNMGAGKSSLTDWLSQQYGTVPFFEPNADNPYLADFYGDMSRYGYSSQIWFLIKRFQIHRRIDAAVAQQPHPVVQDRTLYEDAEIFAAHLHHTGKIDDRDWASYWDLYETLKAELRPPDLLIYLRCPLKTLVKRIRSRGRSYEQKLPRKYLAALEELYEEWFERYEASPKLVIETDRLDYVEQMFDRLEVMQAIEEHCGMQPLSRR